MCDASLSSIGDEIILVNERNELEVKQYSNEPRERTCFIPTAIVKPKYQKLSYDERQLPVSEATITETPRKVQKHLPKLQKSFSKRTCSEEEENEDCGVAANSIAIVPPLKRSGYEENISKILTKNAMDDTNNKEKNPANRSSGKLDSCPSVYLVTANALFG